MTQSTAAASYRAFGLDIISEIELPELGPGAAGIDVEIKLGSVPGILEGGQPVSQGVSAKGGALLVDYSPARYLVRGGREILVEPKAGASDRDIRGFLLGSALGALVHQRGLLPLHANVIDIGGEAVAFAGPQGAGKSTLADFFRRRGRKVLSDDVCVVSFGLNGEALAWPGIPRIKLKVDALAHQGLNIQGLERVFDSEDKFSLPILTDWPAGPLALRSIYFLGKAGPGAKPEIRPVLGAEAFDLLSSNIYRPEFAAPLGVAQTQFDNLLKLLRAARLYLADRTWGFDVFDAQVGEMQQHLQRYALKPRSAIRRPPR